VSGYIFIFESPAASTPIACHAVVKSLAATWPAIGILSGMA